MAETTKGEASPPSTEALQCNICPWHEQLVDGGTTRKEGEEGHDDEKKDEGHDKGEDEGEGGDFGKDNDEGDSNVL
eukprot:15219403-Alexandrium_andersonii.AAC.1